MIEARLPIRAASVFSIQGGYPALEDHVLVSEDQGIFVMADGFGGPVPGAAASKAACEAVRGFLIKEAGDVDATLPFELRSYYSLAGNVLFNSLVHANKKVIALNKGKTVHEKGGASVVAGYLDGDLLALANVGGCTAWMIRQGKLVELVVPRTYGRLRDPFSRGPGTNAPLTALGLAQDLEPEIFEYRVERGDWLLFHTDGLPGEALQPIVALQSTGQSPELAAENCLSLFKERNFDSNMTISLVIL